MSTTATAIPDEATVTQFWKSMTRIDDSKIVEMLFEPADAEKTKDNSTNASEYDDEANDEFFGQTAMVPRDYAKALVNTPKDGTQPLLYAVQNSFDERTVLALVAAGADINAQREKGDLHTPLIAAVWGEDDVLSTALLKHGADITIADGNGMNALHVCASLGAHNLSGHLLANFVKTADDLVAMMSAKESANGMTPMQLVIQELPVSLQQGDKRYLMTLNQFMEALGIGIQDAFPQALAANTRSADDIKCKYLGDDQKDDDDKKKDESADASAEEPTTGGRKVLRTQKNPKIFPTRKQARKIFEQQDNSGANVAHTVSEVLGTIPQAQPLLRAIYAAFGYATFHANVHGSKLFTAQDAEGNTPLHIMLQHAYLTTDPKQAGLACAMVVTTLTPVLRSLAAADGKANNLVREQMRNLVAATKNNEGLSCLGLCAAIADVPTAASLSAELLALWIEVLPNPLDRRGLLGADVEAYRAFLLGWAISKQNAATAVKETNPEMYKTILNPDAERRIQLDMNHCIAKIVGIPNVLGTAETLSIFGGLPKEAALKLRNESVERAAKLAEEATAAAILAEEEEAKAKAAAGGCCGGAPCPDKKGKGDFSGQGKDGKKTEAKNPEVVEKEEKVSAADVAAVSPSKGLKWAAYGLMCMMLMGIFLPVVEFIFPAAKTAAPTRGKPAPKKNSKKSTYYEDEESSAPTDSAAAGSEEGAAKEDSDL